MSDAAPAPGGPDLSKGIALDELTAGRPLFGHAGGDPVMVVRIGEEVRAFGSKCTHYGGPLAEGLVHDGTVRCPWHHACFSVSDGTVRGGPAFNPLPRYSVEVTNGRVVVGEKQERLALEPERPAVRYPESVVVVGAGSAGSSAVETLRREGFEGEIFLVDPDSEAPYDRPNLSKAYLAGDAPAEWLPLRSRQFYEENGIVRLERTVESIDTDERRVTLDDGRTLRYGALLLATGARPRTLQVPGADLAHVHTLRSLADCRGIIDAAEHAHAATIVGASFIGMEVAASLRARGLAVTVVAPEDVPFARTLGPELGGYVHSLHEQGGVSFRLGRTVGRILTGGVVLDDGTEVEGDLVVIGVGVVPDTELARAAGLEVDDGVIVDALLRTSDPVVFAAGDIARYPDPRTGERVRIEHWVVAGRQGRTAARNMLGREETFADVPFFWTRHFGRSVAYVGHAPSWDRTEQSGDCGGDGGCTVRYLQGDRTLAVATVGRSMESLRAEVEMERRD